MASDRDLNYFAGPIKYKKKILYTSKFEMDSLIYLGLLNWFERY